jgi:hypothetical protein
MAGLAEAGYTREEANKQIAIGSSLEKRMSRGDFDNAPIEDAVMLSRLVANSKITSRWRERHIAFLTGAQAGVKSPDGGDGGDLFFGQKIFGRDNAELKSSEKDDRNRIGGGQMRLFENIPYYLFLQDQQGGNDYFTLYLLSKEQIHEEIFVHRVCRCSPSQVSGQTKKSTVSGIEKMSNEEVLNLVQDTFDKKNNILWGFGIDSDPGEFKGKEPVQPKRQGTKSAENYPAKLEKYNKAKEKHQKKVDAINRFNNKYKVTIEQLKSWDNLLKTRYGI